MQEWEAGQGPGIDAAGQASQQQDTAGRETLADLERRARALGVPVWVLLATHGAGKATG